MTSMEDRKRDRPSAADQVINAYRATFDGQMKAAALKRGIAATAANTAATESAAKAGAAVLNNGGNPDEALAAYREEYAKQVQRAKKAEILAEFKDEVEARKAAATSGVEALKDAPKSARR